MHIARVLILTFFAKLSCCFVNEISSENIDQFLNSNPAEFKILIFTNEHETSQMWGKVSYLVPNKPVPKILGQTIMFAVM